MKHALLILLQLASTGSDAYFTNRNAQLRGFREHDPIARPFVIHGTFERGGYFATSAGLAIGSAELLDHYKHHRWALALRMEQIADSSICAAYSATH